MLFINLRQIMLVALTTVTLSGCQLAWFNDAAPARVEVISGSDAEQAIVDFSSKELSEAQKMFNSPNLYLASEGSLPSGIEAKFVAATKQLNEGKAEQAKRAFKQLVIEVPTLSGPWLKLGDIALAQSDSSRALEYFKQAVYVNPHNYVASSRVARLLREQGDFSGAKSHYEMALKSWPGLVSAHINLGILYDLYLGNKEDALIHYKLAQKLNELDNKPLNKRLKIWIIDVSRQLKSQRKQGG